MDETTDITTCANVAAYCSCSKPLGHVDAGDVAHKCRECPAEWQGSIDGPDFVPLHFPEPF